LFERHGGIIGEMSLQDAPDPVIEILSTETWSRDLEIKRKIYTSFGVQEYWVISSGRRYWFGSLRI
jgi:Uma2 family endonuclease